MRVRMTSRNAGYNAGEIASFPDSAAHELIRLGEAEALSEEKPRKPAVERRIAKPARGQVEK